MIDLASSALLLAIVVLTGGAYGVRVARAGRVRSARVDKDQGSLLLPKGPMEMAHWALLPLGRIGVRLGISANAITWASMALATGAAAALASGHFGVAALLTALASLGDALDGIVARESKTASNGGEVLDASVDRYSELLFFVGIAFYFRLNALLLALALAALGGSFMTSYASAKAEALGIEPPRGSMRRPERAMLTTVGAALVPFLEHWLGVAAGGASLGGHSGFIAASPMALALLLVGVLGNISAIRRLAFTARAVDGPSGMRSSVIDFPASPALVSTSETHAESPEGERLSDVGSSVGVNVGDGGSPANRAMGAGGLP